MSRADPRCFVFTTVYTLSLDSLHKRNRQPRYLVPSAGLVELNRQELRKGQFVGSVPVVGAILGGAAVAGAAGAATTSPEPTTTMEPTTTPLPEYEIQYECFPGDSMVLSALQLLSSDVLHASIRIASVILLLFAQVFATFIMISSVHTIRMKLFVANLSKQIFTSKLIY